MSDSEASLIQSKKIKGTLNEENNTFQESESDTIWRWDPKPLGKGGYSKVYLYENGQSKWAVKRIANISGGGRTTTAEVEKEKAAMIKFSVRERRERFVSFIGWFAFANVEYFALEYVEFGDLESNLEKRGKTLPEAEVKTILTQILEGVEFMHAEKYIHRDLKPQNILVAQKGPDWQVKITDLGLSKCTLGVLEGYSFTGTPPYMAPEIYKSFLAPSGYTNAIDMWAIGCIACRMLIGESPFYDPWLLVQYLKAIKQSKPLDQLCTEVPYYPKDLAELLNGETAKGMFVRQLLEPKVEMRLGASRALNHPWFQGRDFCTLRGHALAVKQVVFSPDGKLLVSKSRDNTIRVWSVEERKTKHILDSPHFLDIVRFLPHAKLAAPASKHDESVGIWDMKTGEAQHKIEIGRHYKRAFSPDGSLTASIQVDRTIRLWYTETGAQKLVIQPSEDWLDGMTFSPNGELIALRFVTGKIELKNTENGFEERIFKGDPQLVKALAFSPNGRVIALANYEAFWLWDREEEEAKRVSKSSWLNHQGIMDFSPNGKWVASDLVARGEIILWNTEQKDEPHIFQSHSTTMNMAFAPDSQSLAVALDDGTVVLWDVETKTELYIPQPHLGSVDSVAFSPNGDLLATGSNDGTVGLWNLSQWKK